MYLDTGEMSHHHRAMDTPTRPASRGGQMLLSKLRKMRESLNAFSDRKGYSRGRLSRVVRGETPCTRRMAIDLRDELGIPVDAWDEPPRMADAAAA